VSGRRDDGGFALGMADGSIAVAQRVLLATGMEYRYPTVEGIEERWGRSVFHCPFCHGWEVRDRPLAVLDGGPSGTHRALLLRAWSDDVTLLADGPAALDPEDAERLRAAGVAVDERPVSGLRGAEPGTLEAVTFADGGERRCGGLLVPVTLHQRSDLAEQLGASMSAGPLAADAIDIDGRFATSVPGLFAAGDASALMPSVPAAIATGHAAAGMIVGGMMVGEPGPRRP
jgi:thioredoxin reductase